MPDLYTIVSLVIAVSGATYASIAGLHSSSQHEIKKLEASLEGNLEKIRNYGTDETILKGESSYESFTKQLGVWRESQWWSARLFAIFSFAAAGLVCLLFFADFGIYLYSLKHASEAKPVSLLAEIGPGEQGGYSVAGFTGMVALLVVVVMDSFYLYWATVSAGKMEKFSDDLKSGIKQADELIQKEEAAIAEGAEKMRDHLSSTSNVPAEVLDKSIRAVTGSGGDGESTA